MLHFHLIKHTVGFTSLSEPNWGSPMMTNIINYYIQLKRYSFNLYSLTSDKLGKNVCVNE